VATTRPLSPSWCAAVKSPCSWLVTFRSWIWWRTVSRVILTRRTSALPYWLEPSTILVSAGAVISVVIVLTPSVRGICKRADKKRYVVVLVDVVDEEIDAYRGE